LTQELCRSPHLKQAVARQKSLTSPVGNFEPCFGNYRTGIHLQDALHRGIPQVVAPTSHS
jgi:hypothetical protein